MKKNQIIFFVVYLILFSIVTMLLKEINQYNSTSFLVGYFFAILYNYFYQKYH